MAHHHFFAPRKQRRSAAQERGKRELDGMDQEVWADMGTAVRVGAPPLLHLCTQLLPHPTAAGKLLLSSSNGMQPPHCTKKKQIAKMSSTNSSGDPAAVRVVGGWASPFMNRVVVALKLKGVEHEMLQETVGKKSELLLRSNPVHKKIPVLLHHGKPIAESLIIV
uniref:Glutathione S-transferase n=2 Tax=Oryza sativa subsp. japonica TaxID=39947 RepID=Q109C8_ORYSJ|nr:Glutathione S-transferase, N-terminal domain containing protein [Oryza sativa Japonica Group]